MATIKYVKGAHKEHKPALAKDKTAELCTGMGLLGCVGLIGYFLIMRAFGLHEVLILRGFNLLILLACIIFTLRIHTKSHGKVDYFKGIRMGLHVTLVAVIPFVLFIFFYLRYDDGFWEIVQRKIGMGEYHITPSMVAWVLGVEGIASGAIMSFVAVQYFKKKQETE
jgi:hypothetical protein